LETEFGNDGYAFWFKLLELLANSEGHVYDAGNPAAWKFLLAKTRVSEDVATKIFGTLIDLEAIDRELWEQNRILWVQNLVDNVADVYRYRKTDVPSKPSSNGSKPISDGVSNKENTTSDEISNVGNPHSKVKESKVKNREAPEKAEIEFNDYVEELKPQYIDLAFDNEVKKFHLYWSEGSRKLKRPKFALKNWMDKARTFKEQDGKAGRRSGTKLIPRNNYTRPEDL